MKVFSKGISKKGMGEFERVQMVVENGTVWIFIHASMLK